MQVSRIQAANYFWIAVSLNQKTMCKDSLYSKLTDTITKPINDRI